MPPWWNEFWAKLDGIADMEPGWDTYGAKPIAENTCYRAADVAIALFRNSIDRFVAQPRVVPVPDGSLELHYDQPGDDYEQFVIPVRVVAGD